MRIGLLIDEPQGQDVLGRLRGRIARAADDGFSSAWMSNIFGLDALTALAVAGSQVPGIELGTGVVPTYPRHPAVLAQQALTANAALDGRLALGIGLSHQIVIEGVYGYSFDRPARHMREYLSVLVPLVRGEQVAFEGETLKAQLGLTTPGSGDMPVLIAALAPRMLGLAGELADGTVLWMTGPKTVAEHVVPAVTEAARAAGRPAPRIVCTLPICVTGDVEAARARAGEVFEIYGQLPSYRAVLDREGAAGPADVAIVGDEDAVAAQIESLAQAGVTDFVAAEYTSDRRTREFLRTLL
ncbi:TIGR03564 family F420-dependent LLM class oxidoreductase [Streptosporangium roseum]|uniref:Coenzyme F420-dependent N5 N10-methylene tetrahydromethanopterin reductase-like protein n=1 Tax=Streptosporangium roseum (strain ATCC 12428 / DSM 43021 / JCM 3005 / KCTC 9067 / NCIMB 10171 / NRRL 2505 / NI 9100) TaxID=479432 RepID=D2AWU4_STRRD|nr:TIGR03564 family F420-dependent LLM class oxidoreductase [Streptosporangium roseum]ACZ88872.1 Coenzyme F420-dependent N5 N10-methylene tetrahydromethanopterin reductase-like protein [Streptosporangium roseum DSM 43021]